MAHLCVLTTGTLGYTWIGASDDPAGSLKEVLTDDPPSKHIFPWALFPKHGHFLADLLNAFEKEHISKGWHASPPEVVILTLAGLSYTSLTGYRALQDHYDPSVGAYAWP